MPEERTKRRAQTARAQGKSPTTQAGEFVREEIHHIREGKHGARSTKQAIAIGLSKARKAGVELPPPRPGRASEETRRSAQRDLDRGRGAPPRRAPSARRKRAALGALKREGRSAASSRALSKQARTAAFRRSARDRSQAAQKAVRTKGARTRKAAAKKAARTRAERQRTT
jgi:hypothetical protein